MRNETKEDKIIAELCDVHESMENYINDTLELLMNYGMSEQDAKKSIIKKLNSFFNK